MWKFIVLSILAASLWSCGICGSESGSFERELEVDTQLVSLGSTTVINAELKSEVAYGFFLVHVVEGIPSGVLWRDQGVERIGSWSESEDYVFEEGVVSSVEVDGVSLRVSLNIPPEMADRELALYVERSEVAEECNYVEYGSVELFAE